MFGLFLLVVAKKKKKMCFSFIFMTILPARVFHGLFLYIFIFYVLRHGLNGGVGVVLLFFNPFLRLLCAICVCKSPLVVVVAVAAAVISALFLFKCISPTC